MKHFKPISTTFVIVISIIFCCNVYYLVTLYTSIRENVERDVLTALANADIDDMWERAERTYRKSQAAMEASIAAGDSVTVRHVGNVEGNVDMEGNYVTKTLNSDGDTIVRSMPLRKDNSLTNQMVDDMSRQMHANMDSYIDMDFTVTDSILSERLADRGIYPEFVAVEVIDSTGKVVDKNERIPADVSQYDDFSLCVNPAEGLYYRAYITPLTRHIFSEMAGVIITVFLLMVSFAMAFWYLMHTVAKMRTIEEMKDDFVSNMTHELKTPIAIAYSANDALLNYDAENDPEKKRKYLMIANKQLKRLGELVENILAMSMERRKTMKLKLELILLKPFIEDIASAQRMRKEKDIVIDIDVEGSLTVNVDKTHLANVLNNLIDNAIKYSGDSVKITLSADKQEISIRDNGIGIPAKSLPYIFNKFYRVPHGNLQDVRGYGIGLYYVKSVLDKMGWSVSVRSHEGEGTVFTIKFSDDEK